jgi:hypothetical protein
MAITYSDYGKKTENDFARIKGDKHEGYFKIIFDEAKVYKHDNSYVLAGYFAIISGVAKFGNNPINPGLCEVPIYSSEYEIREKNPETKQYESKKCQPSICEKLYYELIDSNAPIEYMQDGKALKGEITFYPDDSFAAFPDEQSKRQFAVNNFKVELINSSGKYPDWTPPKEYRNNGNSGYAPKGISPGDKISLLKKELGQVMKDPSYKENPGNLPVGAFYEKFIDENRHNPDYVTAFLNALEAIIR